jgi:predicted nuclease of predicted toxin-antitoxin system
MKFVADEGVDRSLVVLLRQSSHDVLYFAETDSGTDDEVILTLAKTEERILITRDKDFGELVYRMNKLHSGIILIRAEELSSKIRSQLVTDFIQANLDKLSSYFIVIQPGTARFRKMEME